MSDKKDCLFCKILKGDLPCNKVYEDDDVLGFEDIFPQADQHDLFIPKKHIETINSLTEKDVDIMGKLVLAAKKVADKKGLLKSGYRIVMNCNEDAGQTVFHIHLHLIGGEPLGFFGARPPRPKP